MKTKFAFCLTGLVLMATARLWAHHSFAAEFDTNKRVALKGVVTKVDWRNPHIYVYLNVKDDQGKVSEWACELGPPNVLLRQGWSRNSVKEGDEVTIDGALAKDSSNRCNGRSVVLAGGRRCSAARPRGRTVEMWLRREVRLAVRCSWRCPAGPDGGKNPPIEA